MYLYTYHFQGSQSSVKWSVIPPDLVKRHKVKWYGHVTWSSGLAKNVLQGTVQELDEQGTVQELDEEANMMLSGEKRGQRTPLWGQALWWVAGFAKKSSFHSNDRRLHLAFEKEEEVKHQRRQNKVTLKRNVTLLYLTKYLCPCCFYYWRYMEAMVWYEIFHFCWQILINSCCQMSMVSQCFHL